MNYTEKYHLPQWEKSDRVLMEDFNQAMGSIEAGLTSAGNAAETASAAATSAAQAKNLANLAYNAASAAQETASKAYNPSYKPYVTGTYTGNGSTVSLYLGFKPSFLIVTGQNSTTSQQVSQIGVVGPGGNLNTCVTLTNSGAQIFNPPASGSMNSFPRLNNSGQTYGYIAFQ